mgnify:CR=1 FL=1|jgi:glycerophosphoryl diester phosphodiesterase
MIPRQEPLAGPAILFASGGARGHTDENTPESFRLAVRLGATGIETDLQVTADGVPVLRRDARLGGLRRRRIADTSSADLPDDVVTLAGFYEEHGTALDLLVHVRTVDAVEEAIALATRHRALDRLWLAASDRAALLAWRARSELVRLVDTTTLNDLGAGAERHAAGLREDRIDAKLLPQADWNGGRAALFHRFGRRCFGTDAHHDRMILGLLHIGMDGVISSYPDRLVDAAAAIARPDAPQFLE